MQHSADIHLDRQASPPQRRRCARIAISQTTTYRSAFDDDVFQFAAAGFDAIGVWREKLIDFGVEKGIELLQESGIKVSSLTWAGGFTGGDGRTFQESLADAHAAIRLASSLGAQTLIVYSGGRAGHTFNHAHRLLRLALTELAPIAATYGVTLAVKPMHVGCAEEWTFLTTAAKTAEFLGELNGELKGAADGGAVKFVFDTYQLTHDGEPMDELHLLVPQIALVQLGDARHPPRGEQNRCRLGEGSLPLADVIGQLNDAGYDGYYEVELMGEDIEHLSYDSLVNHSMQVLDGWLTR